MPAKKSAKSVTTVGKAAPAKKMKAACGKKACK